MTQEGYSEEVILELVIGAIFVVVPVVLLTAHAELKLHGFVRGVVYVISWHGVVALVTQALGVFTYPVLVIFHAVGLALLLWWVLSHQFPAQKWIAWRDVVVVVFVVVIAAAHLHHVHFNYTGDVASAMQSGSQYVENMHYPYPYFSDEWYAVALVKDSIERQALPSRLPFTYETAPFVNYEAVFHSTVGAFILLFRLDPVTQYTLVSIVVGSLLCGLLYTVMRSYTASNAASLLASLSALYLVNGANLPGLWTLIPVTLGTLLLLASVYLLQVRRYASLAFATIATLMVYPPLVVVLVPLFLGEGVIHTKSRKPLSTIFATGVALTFFIVGSFYFFADSSQLSFWKHLGAALVYQSYTPSGIPYYAPWLILPWIVSMGALLGFGVAVRTKRYGLLLATATGALYWVIYANTQWRIIIDYQRVVVVTSILLAISSALGIDSVIRFVRNRLTQQDATQLGWASAAAAGLLFSLFYPLYTDRSDWKQLVLNQFDGQVLIPKAPANNYLTEDDLEVFAAISEKRFLSIPWKGTVIGGATSNHPVETKAGTITLNAGAYRQFMEADCRQKKRLSRRYELDYVYSEVFNCAGFTARATSAEGLTMYEVGGVGRRK